MIDNFFDFNIAEERKKKIVDFYEGLKADDKSVFIFGVGEYAEKMKSYLESKNVFVKGFVLNDHFAGKIPGVMPLSSMVSYENVCMIYGLQSGYSKRFFKMVDQVKDCLNKCKNATLFVPSDYWLLELDSQNFSHEFIDVDFVKKHYNELRETYEILADDLSKSVMTEYLYSSVSCNADNLAQLGLNWDYDYDLDLLFKECDGDVVIECGAFDGKTIAEASLYTENKYDMIALECDQDNYRKCCERLKDFSNVSVLKFGAWDKRTKLAVVQMESASFLKEVDENTESTNVVDVLDIDSLVTTKKIAAIIMDIEGSEMKALIGAQNAIMGGANLAIRVYHKKEDLISIPQFIRKLNSNYRFYLRYEKGASLCRAGDETTLYAICE